MQWIMLYCTVLYCTVLYCTVLYCTALYCTVLHCTVLQVSLAGEEEPWRRSLLTQLQANTAVVRGDQYREYLAAVETTSWVKTSLVKVRVLKL